MHTVIVGSGVAGLKAAREVSKRNLGKVTLISQDTEFIYHSMLYKAATGAALASSISLKDAFVDDKNVTVIKGTLESLDVEHKQITCSDESYTYDSLILALGASADFFGVPGADRHSFGIETLKKAEELRRHIHDDIAVDRQLDKQYVIVGGGLTGVELAGSLGAYIRKVATAHSVTKGKVRVLLVEQEDRLLPLCSRTASSKAAHRLKKLGVDVRLGHRVESLTDEYIVIDGKKISTGTIVWTCGSKGNAFFAEYPRIFKIADDDRVVVNDHLEAYDSIYVIGDSAALPYGGRVSSAMREARYIARYLDRKLNKQPTRAFKPKRTATYLQIGDSWSYVEKYGIYAAGVSGYALFRLHERYVLESLLPSSATSSVVAARPKMQTDCGLCDT